MQNQQVGVSSKSFGCEWSNRILILATAGILFLTLYPFRFDFLVVSAAGSSPLFLGRSFKPATFLDAFLNVLLFVPFGFGLAEKLRERGKSFAFTLAISLLAGALFSYTIELLQYYITQRDSGWEDVFTNGSGSVVGCVMYEILGSFLLQRNSRLSNWRADAQLVVGNDASGKFPWKGTVNAVQIWDLALRKEVVQQLFAGQPVDTANPGLLVDYDFSAGPPFRNQRQISSELAWVPRAPVASESGLLTLDGVSWLTTSVAVPDLIANLQKTNQFTVRVLCTPAETDAGDARIVAISQPPGFSDLTLRQEGSDLVFWFRNPLSANHAILAWYYPRIFTAGRTRDILYTYDGSNLSLFIEC